jgi:hypothetical protein
MLSSLKEIVVVCTSFPIACCRNPFACSNDEAVILAPFEFWMDESANPCVTFS